jgi:hydrogenase maturation protease
VRVRIIGLGQAAAGDDGAGLAVLAELRTRGLPADVEVMRAAEDSALVSLLQTEAAVILVDALLAETAGQVLELAPEQLAHHGMRCVSTHGTGVGQAIELARILAPRTVASNIRIVGITIVPPRRYAQQLSPAVAAAVTRAAARIQALVSG